VPFGEYIPFGDLAYRLFGLAAFASQQGAGYSAGVGAAVLDLGPKLGHVLPLICYEAVFPQDLRAAPMRADWIVQITNDAWFGKLTGPWQHLAQARLRAIEQGLPLLRAANTGISAVIDARGRVVAALPLGVADYIDAALPPPLPPTVYARLGDLPLLVLLLALGAGLLVGARPRKA
jgi:apolipoprotein N-acyltransferase